MEGGFFEFAARRGSEAKKITPCPLLTPAPATATPIPHDRTSWRSLARADGRLRERAYALQQRPRRYVAGERLGRPTGPVVRGGQLHPEDSLHRKVSSGFGRPANFRS